MGTQNNFPVTVDSENNLKIYRDGALILILFILEADDGKCTVGWGLGDEEKNPLGQRSGPLVVVSTRDEAERIVAFLSTILNNYLDRDNGDYTVRGFFGDQ